MKLKIHNKNRLIFTALAFVALVIIVQYQNCSSTSSGCLSVGGANCNNPSGGKLSVMLSPATSTINVGSPSTFVATPLANTGTVTYTWSATGASAAGCTANMSACPLVFSSVGTYIVSLTIKDGSGATASSMATVNVVNAGGGGTASGTICARSTTSSPCNTGTVTCSIPSTNPAGQDASHCGVVLEWSTTNVTSAKVVVTSTGGVFSTALSGSGVAPWIDTNATVINLVNNSTGATLASVTVQGTVGAGNATGSICARATSSAPCNTGSVQCAYPSTDPAGVDAGHCGVVIEWSSTNGNNVQIKLGETGQMFAAGASGSGVAPWIASPTYTFQVVNNGGSGPVLASVAVSGVPASTADRACFFTGANYTGTSFCLSKGQSVSNLNGWVSPQGAGGFNDQISSVQISGSVNVLYYQDSNFSGNGGNTTVSLPDLGNYLGGNFWDNQFSSLNVQ